MRLHPQVLQIGVDWGDGSHTKLYLVEGERRALIDTGVRTSPTAHIAPYLAHFGYQLSNVDLILNTHGHEDHAGGNLEVQRVSKAPIWMHEADVYFVENPGLRFDAYRAPMLRLMGKQHSVAAARADFVARIGEPQKVARALRDGDVIELGKGVELRVVALPGHTSGSVGYYWEREGMLFCGDSAMGQGSRPGSLPALYHPLSYLTSLRCLIDLPLRLMGLAHFYQGLTVSANPIKMGTQIRQYLTDCQDINHLIMEAMGRAMHRYYGEPFPRIMADAVHGLKGRMWLVPEPATGMPANAALTLASYFRELEKLSAT